MNTLNILIVEDESIVALEIESYVQKLHYHVIDICSNAEDALHIVETQPVNIVLMDICIKGERDGIEASSLIKASHPNIEIIFLTAHLDDYNVDRALEVNPTAYLSKPFNRDELRIFLKIAERKILKDTDSDTNNKHFIHFDEEFAYDTSNQTLLCCNEIIQLTKKEHQLLELFITHKNSLLDFYTIENSIWPDKSTNVNTLRTLVKRVRQKLKHKFIETVSSRGYKFSILQRTQP